MLDNSQDLPKGQRSDQRAVRPHRFFAMETPGKYHLALWHSELGTRNFASTDTKKQNTFATMLAEGFIFSDASDVFMCTDMWKSDGQSPDHVPEP